MAKKLQPDVIEWILKLNSTQAQDEYHKLEKANRDLQNGWNGACWDKGQFRGSMPFKNEAC